MRTIRVWLSTNVHGSECSTEFEVEDDATDEEIEQIAMELRWNFAEWGWEDVS